MTEDNKHIDKKIEEVTSKMSVPGAKSKDTAWNDVLNKIEVEEKKKSSFPAMWAAASVLLLVASYFLFFYGSEFTVTTAPTQMLAVDLPDGSKVTLSPVSSLTYDEDSWEDHREVQLSGQARFEVVEGSTFKVVSDQGAVTVLGTIFDVVDRQGKYEVSCSSGKVEVEANHHKKALTAHQGVRLESGSLTEPKPVNLDKMDGWIRGEYIYNDEPLGEVLNELERQFAITFERPDGVNGREYSGFFTNKNLTEALDMVLPPMNLSYQVKGNIVSITSNE